MNRTELNRVPPEGVIDFIDQFKAAGSNSGRKFKIRLNHLNLVFGPYVNDTNMLRMASRLRFAARPEKLTPSPFSTTHTLVIFFGRNIYVSST